MGAEKDKIASKKLIGFPSAPSASCPHHPPVPSAGDYDCSFKGGTHRPLDMGLFPHEMRQRSTIAGGFICGDTYPLSWGPPAPPH